MQLGTTILMVKLERKTTLMTTVNVIRWM